MIDKFFKLPNWLLIAVSIILLSSLCFYSWFHEKDKYKGIKEKISNFKQNTNKKVVITYTEIIDKNGQEILVKNRRGDLFRLFPVDSIQMDQYYSFSGRIRPDGRVEIIHQYLHPRWQLKHILSLLSVILVLYYIIIYIRFDKNTHMFYIKEKRINA